MEERKFSEQELVRREKMQELIDKGIDPFGQRFDVTAYSKGIKEQYGDKTHEELEEMAVEVAVAGRIMTKRRKGKVCFMHIQDRDGQIQLYVRKDTLGEEVYEIVKKGDIGDIIGVKGTVFMTNTGECSIKVSEYTHLTKALRPLPEKFHGSDLYHGKYYVKEEVRKPGYLPNEEIWEMDASYTDQNLAEIKLTKEVENQPTESQFTKTDATTGEELEGAKLQIIDKEGNIVEEWISAKEPHVVYGLPEGTYILHEELPPYAEGYVSAEDIEFEVKEDGSVTKVEMKDDYSKVEISKTDITTGEELEGAKLQILNKEGEILEEWVTDGKPHLVEKLPVGEELTLREITAPEGYEIAEDVKFTLEDTMEIQMVEMKDARTSETPGVPQTGDDHWKPILLFVLLGASAAGLMATMIYKKKHGKTEKADETKKEE